MALKDTPTHTRKIADQVRCKYRRIWDSLDAADQATLTEWLDRGLGTTNVRAGLKDDGHNIGEVAVAAHFKGNCCCDPDQEHDPAYGITVKRNSGATEGEDA